MANRGYARLTFNKRAKIYSSSVIILCNKLYISEK